MKPIGVWGWLGGHDGQRPMDEYGQDAGVTPNFFSKDILGFLMTTESQDLGLTSHPKDGAFSSIVSRHYTGALGPTQTTGWAPPAGLTNARDDRKATVTQTTTRCNQGMQNTISECTTRWTLKQMSSSSRRPHRVPLLSAKNRKRRLQFTQTHQNCTIEDCKNVAWSDESWFLMRHSDSRVRIWCKEHESMDPSFLISTDPAAGGGGGVIVWGVYSWHTLGPLVPIEHCLNTTAYLSIYCWPCPSLYNYSVPIFWCYFQQDNAQYHKAQIISDWFLEHDNEFTLLKWPPQSPDLRFSIGFMSGMFAGQSSTVTHGHWTSFWYLWQCGQVPSPAGKWNQHLHKACQQKEAWSDLKCPGRWLRWLCTSENTVDQHQQMTWQPKSSLTVETSHWTSSNLDSVPLHSSSRLWDLDLQMKYNIYFHLKRGLWTTEQQSSYFSP